MVFGQPNSGPIGWHWCIDSEMVVLELMSTLEIKHLFQSHDNVY